MVVFACITTEGYINTPHSAQAKCIFNQNDSACHYAVGIGVIAFLACVAFLLLDVYVPFMSNAQERKYAVIADLGFSGKQEHWSDFFVCSVKKKRCFFKINFRDENEKMYTQLLYREMNLFSEQDALITQHTQLPVQKANTQATTADHGKYTLHYK